MKSAAVRVTLLGTGSSGGVPRIGNDWGACDPHNPRNRRRRCACLIEGGHSEASFVESVDTPPENSNDEITSILIDTGPDMREQLLSANVRDLQAVLLTHSHADHIAGLDDLRQLWVTHRRPIDVYMDELTSQQVMAAFSYCFRQPEGSSYPPFCQSHELLAGKVLSVEGPGGSIDLLPIQVEHGDIHALGFRMENLAYVPDVKTVKLAESLVQLQGLDTLVIDALRRNPHPTHMSLQDALAFVEMVAPRRAVLTNLHSDMDYDQLRASLPENIEPGFDGMTLPIRQP